MNRGESMAARQLRRLAPDRAVQREGIREKFLREGAVDELREYDRLFSEWEQQEESAQYDSPTTAMIDMAAVGMKTALRELGADEGRLSSTLVTSTPQEDVSARTRFFSDGSALVMISDPLVTLCYLYCQHMAASFLRARSENPLTLLARAGTLVRARGDHTDTELLTGLLRYYNTRQRAFGLPGKLGVRETEGSQARASWLNQHALRFVIGHELAHRVLDHTVPESALSPDGSLASCTQDQKQELDADLLAYKAAVKCAESMPSARGPGPRLLAHFGALIAMLAVWLDEEALFVRRGVTHPPAVTRMRILAAQTSPWARAPASVLLSSALQATQDASAFAAGARWFHQDFVKREQVTAPLTSARVHRVSTLDRIQCSPDWWLVERLSNVTDLTGARAPWVGEAAGLAAGGAVQEALSLWGVPEDTATRFCDPRRKLRFHTLVEGLRASFAAQGVPSKELYSPVAAATLTARRLVP